MSLTDILLGPECGIDIYEETNEDKWVECQTRKSLIGLYFFIPIAMVIILLCLWLGSPLVRMSAAIIGGIVITGAILNHIYIVPNASRTNYQRYQKEIAGYTQSGISRADAIREIKKEQLERENIAAQYAAANTQARATLSSGLAIASALKGKK